MSKISIVIPTLNEAESIGKLITHLFDSSDPKNIADIIVVDCGSSDGTKKKISAFQNVLLLNSEMGRAKQMNVGANFSSGSILYFLHADSYPQEF